MSKEYIPERGQRPALNRRPPPEPLNYFPSSPPPPAPTEIKNRMICLNAKVLGFGSHGGISYTEITAETKECGIFTSKPGLCKGCLENEKTNI